MKRFLALAAAALMALALFAGCSKEDEGSHADASGSETQLNSLEKVKQAGKLILGLDDSFPPMGYRDDNDEIVGYDIDLAKEVASRMGVELVLQPIDWDYKESELNDGNIDCIWNGMSIDDERREKLNLSEPYLNNQQVVVVLSDSGINTLADLAGKEVILQAGSTAEGALDSHPEVKETLKDGQAIPVDNNVQAMMELKNGTGDAVIMDAVVARYYLNLEDGDAYKILDEVLSEEEYAIGFRKGDQELRDEVQKILGEMKADGKLAEITIKWFGEDISKVPDNQ